MPKSYKIGGTEAHPILEFFPEKGGLLNQLNLKLPSGSFINILSSVSDEKDLELNPTFKNIPLFPFPNRLDNGRYEFDGVEYQFPINEPEKRNNLHGFAFDQGFFLENTEVSPDLVKTSLKFVYDGLLDFYPFPSSVEMHFEVKEQVGLEVCALVKNLGSKPMPVGFGWHPYFSLAEATDSLSLKLPPVKRKAMNDRALPTGESDDFESFSRLAPIGDVFLDDCFELLASQDKASVILWSEKQQFGLDIWQQAGGEQYQYIQVFTHPQRDRIAVEPMTCNVNAFQNGEGLQVLQPGEVFQAKFGVKLISSLDEV